MHGLRHNRVRKEASAAGVDFHTQRRSFRHIEKISLFRCFFLNGRSHCSITMPRTAKSGRMNPDHPGHRRKGTRLRRVSCTGSRQRRPGPEQEPNDQTAPGEPCVGASSIGFHDVEMPAMHERLYAA